MPSTVHRTKLRRHRSRTQLAAMKKKQPEQLEPDGPPTVWPYRRCSHPDSRETGVGLDVQQDKIANYTAMLLAEHPGMVRAEITEDDDADLALSAWKHAFRDRPAGKALMARVRRGDHIVVAEMTRGFRNTKDFLNTLDDLNARGVTLHLADMNLDMTSSVGRMTGSILVVVAEWQAAEMSLRAYAVIAREKRLGHAGGGRPPVGWRNTGPKGKRVRVPDPKHRDMLERIVAWHEDGGLSWDRVADRVEECLADQQGRPPYRRGDPRRRWGHSRCEMAYHSAIEIREYDQES